MLEGPWVSLVLSALAQAELRTRAEITCGGFGAETGEVTLEESDAGASFGISSSLS